VGSGKNTLMTWRRWPRVTHAPKKAKVFWFFFLKKNVFLPALPDPKSIDMIRWLAFLVFVFAHAAQARIADVPLGDGLTLPYYVSDTPDAQRILIAVQGYTRDANRTFAAAQAASASGTLVVAPIFQVSAAQARKCHYPGVPGPGPHDAVWTCGDWSDGGVASNGSLTSFQAMDRLIAALVAQDAHARVVTVAGFSAGGQYVQRYAGFANLPSDVRVRYVVADPSGWLYFDAFRPLPNDGACPGFNDWKDGTGRLPAALGRDAAAARRIYAAADVTYLEGALDTGAGPGTAYKLLERDCGAELQGAYRLDRGQNYAAYDRAMLAHGAHRLIVVPGCAHAVTCVFPSAAARAVLSDGG
jgi:hypothetical protein